MEISFQRYLTAKRTVDDRAINRVVWAALQERLAEMEGVPMLQVLELGGGVGTMFQRMAEWGLLARAEYTLLDEQEENIQAARISVREWAGRQRLGCREESGMLALAGRGSEFRFVPMAAEVTDFLQANTGQRWDLIVAHAFLDLLDIPAVLPLFKAALRPGGLMYLTINFDGMTAFEPEIDPELDERIITLYHRTMDERVVGGHLTGGSRTGRRMFTWLPASGLRILEAGSSDWTVYPAGGCYHADEAYFLHFILSFFSQSLRGREELGAEELERWLAAREKQIQRGELVFMAHQYDFLVEAG
jgi:SAM-dependent methyltransferase